MKQLSLFSQPATLARAGAEGRVYVKGSDLYYGDTSGTEIRITANGAVNATGSTGGGSTGVTDHGALTGLSDDDHPQYGKLSDAEAVTGVWDFQSGLRITKTYTSAGLPAANTLQNALVIVRDSSDSASLQWSALKADGSTWAWVVIGIALP